MYGWIVKRLRNAEAEHTKYGEDKLAVLCRDAASVVVELNTRNKTLRELLRDRDTTIDSLNVSLETYRGLTEAMQQNQQPRWIPVQERLPEDRVPVQVCYIGMNTGTVESDLLACRYYGAWCYWDGEPCSYDECKVEITHWMPLARPPKEEA